MCALTYEAGGKTGKTLVMVSNEKRAPGLVRLFIGGLNYPGYFG